MTAVTAVLYTGYISQSRDLHNMTPLDIYLRTCYPDITTAPSTGLPGRTPEHSLLSKHLVDSDVFSPIFTHVARVEHLPIKTKGVSDLTVSPQTGGAVSPGSKLNSGVPG